MSKKITDVFLRNVKPTEDIQKILIGEGLYLFVRPTGKKVWHLRYYSNQERRNVVLGEYPEMSLKEAVRKADEMKGLAKAEGVNLGEEVKKTRRIKAEQTQAGYVAEGNTFIAVAEKWLEEKNMTWVPGHLKRQKERLQGHLYQAIGNKPVNDVTMSDIIEAIRPLTQEGKSETAKRSCDLARNVLEYANLLGILENGSIIHNITKYRRAIPFNSAKRNFYQDMEPEQVSALLLALEESKMRWTKSTSVASRLAPYVFLRASELCGAEWTEIDTEKGEWLIPASRMKSRREHLVPLSRQAIALLEEIRPLSGGGIHVFPSQSKPKTHITTNAIIQVLRRIGYKSTREEGESFVTHAFRGLASTTLYQVLKYPGEYIEHQLAHVEENQVKRAYNQITARSYLVERRKMMQEYADYLDALREKAKS